MGRCSEATSLKPSGTGGAGAEHSTHCSRAVGLSPADDASKSATASADACARRRVRARAAGAGAWAAAATQTLLPLRQLGCGGAGRHQSAALLPLPWHRRPAGAATACTCCCAGCLLLPALTSSQLACEPSLRSEKLGWTLGEPSSSLCAAVQQQGRPAFQRGPPGSSPRRAAFRQPRRDAHLPPARASTPACPQSARSRPAIPSLRAVAPACCARRPGPLPPSWPRQWQLRCAQKLRLSSCCLQRVGALMGCFC